MCVRYPDSTLTTHPRTSHYAPITCQLLAKCLQRRTTPLELCIAASKEELSRGSFLAVYCVNISHGCN